MAHLEYQARTVVMEGRDGNPQRAAPCLLHHDLERTSAGPDRLLRQAAATRAARRTAPEQLTARPSESVVRKFEQVLERPVPYKDRADAIGHGYPVRKLREHLFEQGVLS